MDMIDLLCRDPGPRLVIWGNSDSILPPWGEGDGQALLHTIHLQTIVDFIQRGTRVP